METSIYEVEDEYKTLLLTILDSRVEYRENLKEDILQELTSPGQHETEALKIEELQYDIIDIERRFEKVCNKYISYETISHLKKSINDCNLNKTTSTVGELDDIGNMVESTFLYDKLLACNMAEQICYIKKISQKWRSICGDGNCFYRSAIFGYLENLIFEKDIIMLKKIIVDIDVKFSEDYYNMKNLNRTIKESFILLNKKLVIAILYLIYDTLDSIKIKVHGDEEEKVRCAYIYLIKAMNYSKPFDYVYKHKIGNDIIFKIYFI